MKNKKKKISASDGGSSKEIKAVMTRRDFLKVTGVIALAAGASGCNLIKSGESPVSRKRGNLPIESVRSHVSMVFAPKLHQ